MGGTVPNNSLSYSIFNDVPYIFNYHQTNNIESVLNQCNGSIYDIGISGGTSPYTILIEGPSSYTANSLSISNLCGGEYTATTTDSLFSSSTTYITIETFSGGTLSATTIDDSCLTNINDYCKIKVHSYEHSEAVFTYALYKDGNMYEKFDGVTGQEVHTFENLPPANYTLTSYDGVSMEYKSIISDPTPCNDGYMLNSKNFGTSINTYTGLSSNLIVNEWIKTNFWNERFITFKINEGPQTIAPFTTNTSVIAMPTGILPSGEILVDDPHSWLYTGETSNRLTENTYDWYLGSYNIPMEEGDNVGPSVSFTLANRGVYYYNSYINKFVILINNNLPLATNMPWFTIASTTDRGGGYFPIATNQFTGTSYYNSEVINNNNQVGYTVTGSSMDVVNWVDLTPAPNNSALNLDTNDNGYRIILSSCSYGNYEHEFSIGSSNGDNDNIGFVIAAVKDRLGIWGPKGSIHTINYDFSGNGVAAIRYNGLRNGANAFIPNNWEPQNCGYTKYTPTTNTYGCVAADIIGGQTMITLPETRQPFSVGAYGGQGMSYVKVSRTGLMGEKFKIQMTDTLTSADVGTPQTFNSDYEVNFNILDSSTWINNEANFSSENYINSTFATPKELYKFLGATHVGYTSGSQPDTLFINIQFTGTQSNDIYTVSNFAGSETLNFPLYNKSLNGVDMSISTTSDFYTSIGSGGKIGTPTVPRIRPRPTVLLQTTEIPLVKLSGGTKISASTESYTMLNPNDYIVDPTIVVNGVESSTVYPCVDITFDWYKNTTNLENGDMVPYYSVHKYTPSENEFDPQPIGVRIFDNPLDRSYSTGNRNQIIGTGIKAKDCFDYGTLVDSSEFLIKPNYIFKDKLKNLKTTPSNTVTPTPTNVCDDSGTTKGETWYDTFLPGKDFALKGGTDSTGMFAWDLDGQENIRKYGLYDDTTDFYFINLPSPDVPNLFTSNIAYGSPTECGNLYTQQVIVASAMTSGTTTSPLLVSGHPYTIILDFPSGGGIQVTTNGLTQYASQYSDFTDNGDYYVDGSSIIKFRQDTLEPDDLINLIYVPGTNERSYYYDTYVTPSSIPHTSGGTSITGNTLYTNGYYYFFNLTYEPIGDIGLVLNGTVLSQGNDYILISNRLVQFTGIQYPMGLQVNDVISQFYFTKLTLQGASLTKNPTVMVDINYSSNYVNELTLFVKNTNGEIVYTETQTSFENEKVSSNRGQVIKIEKTFTITVPTPGSYTYEVLHTMTYTLINGEEINNSVMSSSYPFKISAAVFYDTSGEISTNNITPTVY